MPPIRLLLADDHALVREGFAKLFSITTDIVVVAEAINGTQVLEALHRGQFDLVLLDMTMPGIAGPDLITRILSMENPPPILVLSMHNEPQIAKRAIAAGAAGYLTKDISSDVLLTAIRKTAAGGRYLDPSLAETLAFESLTPAKQDRLHESLTDRELQVFVLFAKGYGVNDIAEQLSISNKTVSTHKTRLMEKMGWCSNIDLVRYAINQKLTD